MIRRVPELEDRDVEKEYVHGLLIVSRGDAGTQVEPEVLGELLDRRPAC